MNYSLFSVHAKAMVAVAQLVESRIVIPVVAGSSPVSHPILFIRLCLLMMPYLLRYVS